MSVTASKASAGFANSAGQDMKSHAILNDVNELISSSNGSPSSIFKMIFDPLISCVEAQNELSLGFQSYLTDMCFETDKDGKTGDPKYVQFTYYKTSPIGMMQGFKLSVPMITLIPMPVLRLDLVSIQFKCKINTVDTYSDSKSNIAYRTDTTLTMKGDQTSTYSKNQEDAMAKISDFSSASTGAMSSLTATQVSQSKSKDGFEITKEFTYEVKVKAVSDTMPAGFEKLIDILVGAIEDIAADGNKDSISGVMGAMAPDLTKMMGSLGAQT